MTGLYIHIPFCIRKCRYCDFYSVPNARPIERQGFLGALEREVQALPKDFAPDTMYIGGGTPTALEVGELERLLAAIRPFAGRVREWSCEVNPGTLTEDKATLLRRAGVNRVSLGVQSLDDGNLAFLGRVHTARDALDSFRMLREAGFENVGVDLLYAIPGSSRERLRRDLEEIIRLGPEHVSCYALIFEEGTPLTCLRDAGEVAEVPDEEQGEQYRLVQAVLAVGGYRHYEISNFARPGFECRHNILYWTGGDYVGCGPAAHSHEAGARYANVADLAAYVKAMEEGVPAHAFEERLSPEARACETLVMGLRCLDGVDRTAFRDSTGFDYRELRGEAIEWLCGLGFLEEVNGRLRLTEDGLFVSDAVFAELI